MELSDEFTKRKEEISKNLKTVRRNIAEAAESCGRDPEKIRLLVVTKNHPASDAYALWQLGERDFGENRVQELTAKMEELAETDAEVNWHMIGTLQRNKVKYISGKMAMIHSVDSLRLARRIQNQAEKRNVTEEILLQVNYSGEESKHGFSPEGVKEALPELLTLPSLHLRGLMTMAEYDVSEERIEETFDGVRKLAETLKTEMPEEKAARFDRLSMGMSHDYEIAVRCGATDLRIGSAILGQRNYG